MRKKKQKTEKEIIYSEDLVSLICVLTLLIGLTGGVILLEMGGNDTITKKTLDEVCKNITNNNNSIYIEHFMTSNTFNCKIERNEKKVNKMIIIIE